MRLALLTALFLTPVMAHAAIDPHYLDIKLPTQQMVEKQSLSAPWGGYSTWVYNGGAGPTSASATTVTTGFSTATLDYARNLTLQASGPDYNKLLGGTITVSGTNYLGNVISETFVVAAGRSTAITGTKAFKTVTSIAYPASFEASPFNVNWYLGMGTTFGFKRCMVDAASFFHAAADGVKEGTAPTLAANTTAVEVNTAIFNTAPNHSRSFDLYFMQNFRCTR